MAPVNQCKALLHLFLAAVSMQGLSAVFICKTGSNHAILHTSQRCILRFKGVALNVKGKTIHHSFILVLSPCTKAKEFHQLLPMAQFYSSLETCGSILILLINVLTTGRADSLQVFAKNLFNTSTYVLVYTPDFQ